MPSTMNTVPPPRPIGTQAAWTGAELALRDDWMFSVEDDCFDAQDRPTAALEQLAARVGQALHDGPGVALLRGFPLDGPRVRERYLAFAALLGEPVVQNRTRDLIRDIRDNGGSRVESPARLNWHNDRADIVGLLTLAQAAEGGTSRIASVACLHDTLLRERPDLVQELYAPYHRSSIGDEVGTTAAIYALPVFLSSAGTFSSDLSRTYIEQAQTFAHVPRLRPAQIEALDELFRLADALAHEHPLAPGDLQLLNNHVTYHARTAYRDEPASGRCRHLLRVWLSTALGRRMRREQAALWSSPELTRRRGGAMDPTPG